MSLPPGFLDELRSRLSLVQVAGRKVTWDTRKSNQGRGDMWAPCPFHQEKTASFHVDDRKGFYYCFGCHAKGDVFRFVQETENTGFMEAVELLAREAGLSMPARDPQAQEKADRRTQLADVAEQAAQFFRMQLATGAGAAARDYLTGRGLDDAARDRWDIGFAPDGWQNLWDHLRGKGIAEDLILDAGLARPSSKGGKPYDVFRNRIMFPIRDARGRCIAFGGRAMDPNDNAKYLNSPETVLFDKGRNLFNHGPAREAAGKGQPLLVAEGYMDVIALAGAGFAASVAPLGTAVTETQLQLLWRIAPEPVIALDGDTAGLRAAMRLIDLALPLLEAGKSLRFALMPEGLDPDDLIRSRGAAAMQSLIDAAIPMVDLLWRRETEGRVFDSPERKAALEKTLKDRVAGIRDQTLRNHYERALRDLQWQLFRPARKPGQPGRGRAAAAPAGPAPVTRASALVSAGEQAEERMRIEVILATALVTPEVVQEFEAGIEDLPCADREQARLRDLILRHAGAGAMLTERIAAEIGPGPLENLLTLRHVAISPCLRRPGDVETARMTVAEELAKLKARRGAMAEIEEAAEELTGAADEALTWRLGQAAEARNRAERSETKDRAEYDIGDNGARIDRAERSALDALLEGIRFDKPRR
ncbi:DNA primase [Pukyongiella litopenaei]|uniref:DNA primase n=1 Tax=Pukyongiella litopenaei TaxID=2605946 RepID=A0A2S0MV02_9RHOB|nr:DNA primase [Pukyongiella litopenaei]AVO39551.1 DNA primase [Pukyongiella litopenaei]